MPIKQENVRQFSSQEREAASVALDALLSEGAARLTAKALESALPQGSRVERHPLGAWEATSNKYRNAERPVLAYGKTLTALARDLREGMKASFSK